MLFLKTYFKTRGLRQIIQWLIIAAISILSLSAFAVADAFAASTPSTCGGADLTGMATAAFPNTDVLDFTDPPNAAYRAEICPYISPNTYIELKGWVWDTNLGWISLYCKDGNAELACGSYNYGVKINKADGKMYGWAWGDSVGWISFGCGADGKNDGADCGAITYEGTTNLIVDQTLGNISGYAWADTVGWFSLNGLSSNILPIVVPISEVEGTIGIWTKVENNNQVGAARNAVPDKNTAPVADGSQSYDIFINLANFNGDPLDLTDPNLTVDITTNWEDSVKYDQTTSGTENHNDNNSGPVTKPLDQTYFTDTKTPFPSASPNTLSASVTTKAPIGLNCYDEGEDGTCDFNYQDFGEAVPSQTLRYVGTTVNLQLTHADLTVENMSAILPPLPPLSNGLLTFVPPVELTTFNYLPDPTDLTNQVNYIESYRNKPDYFNIVETTRGAAIPSAVVNLKLKADASEDVTYGWINSLDDIGEPAPGSDSKLFVAGTENIAMPYSVDEQLEGLLVDQAKAYSEVSYTLGGNPVKYYSNGVPRISGSTIINQTAQLLSGVLSSSGTVQLGENITPSIGDLSTNELRTAILRNVSSLIGGITPTGLDGEPYDFNENESYTELSDGYVYYYYDADVSIKDLSWLSGFGHPVTLIVKGDVYIDTNINSPTLIGTDPGYPVGIIVLEKDKYTDESDRGGRIYVHSDVTDLVNVFIYSDHAMYRYTTGICYFTGAYGPDDNLDGTPDLLGQKEPNFVDSGRCVGFKEPTTTLKNQFYLKGTVATENCISCSGITDLYRGDGKRIGPTTPKNFAISRLYDLNYFSYFRQKPDTTLSGTQSESMILISTARGYDMFGPVYFDYIAPPSNLAGFNTIIN